MLKEGCMNSYLVKEIEGDCQVCEESKILRSVSYYQYCNKQLKHFNENWCEDCFKHAKALKGYYKIRKNW